MRALPCGLCHQNCMFTMKCFSLVLTIFYLMLLATLIDALGYPCQIPHLMQGQWYSYEGGKDYVHVIEEYSMSDKGRCVEMLYNDADNVYRNFFLFNNGKCKTCVGVYYRTPNVLEKKQTTCHRSDIYASIQVACAEIIGEYITLETMFNLDPKFESCRASFEGVWQFAYQYETLFVGRCNHPFSNITACQRPGINFEIENQRFYMNYRKCTDVETSFDYQYRYGCLGQWVAENGNRYIVAVNMGEDQNYLRFSCFVDRTDQPLLMTKSRTASCSELKNAKEGYEQLTLTTVKSETVMPGCKFPDDFRGEFYNTANYDSLVIINSTHIHEISRPDQGPEEHLYYVCQQSRDSRWLTAKLGVGGCQVDYMCWDFLPRHHNLIRFRQGRAFPQKNFRAVCSWTAFSNAAWWRYNILVSKNPVPVPCSIRGMFTFQQAGQTPLTIREGVTKRPQDPAENCTNWEQMLKICPDAPDTIKIDIDRCMTLDYRAQPNNYKYEILDYEWKCLGYWNEDTTAFIYTYDPEDAYSKYRCWILIRDSYGQFSLSRSHRSSCGTYQQPTSQNFSEGASLKLTLIENERLHDNCPIHFYDGTDPKADNLFLKMLESGATSKNKTRANLLLFILIIIINNISR